MASLYTSLPSLEQMVGQVIADELTPGGMYWLVDALQSQVETPADPKTGLLWARQYLDSESFRTWLMYDQATLFSENNQLVPDARPTIARNQMDMVGIFIDGDKWKHINITRGHQAGDEAIISLGEKLQSLFRSEDRVLRFGGDEFVVLLKNIPRSRVEELGTVVQDRLSNITLKIDGDEIHKSATIGIASCPMIELDKPEGYEVALYTLDVAEKEMLDAKQVRYEK